MRLLLFHPGAARIDCEECQQFVFNLDTGEKETYRSGPTREQLPLVRGPGVPTPCNKCPKESPEKAREIFDDLRTRLPAEFDEGGSIGKRYRRQDEIGTPWGITVDHQTMEDDTVTLRDRDSLEQARVPIEGLGDDLAARLTQPWRSPKLD